MSGGVVLPNDVDWAFTDVESDDDDDDNFDGDCDGCCACVVVSTEGWAFNEFWKLIKSEKINNHFVDTIKK